MNDMLSSDYEFTVRWSSLPKASLDSLHAKEVMLKQATPDEESELRIAIANKLITDYNAFKDTHPGLQKHPGLTIYKSVTDQVIA